LTFLAALSDQFISQISVARHLREARLQPLLDLVRFFQHEPSGFLACHQPIAFAKAQRAA